MFTAEERARLRSELLEFAEADTRITGAAITGSLALRDQALALACVSRRLPAIDGRGFHQLPTEVLEQFETTLVRELTPSELLRAFRELTDALVCEVKHADPELARRLQGVLLKLPEIASATSHPNSG
jgi:hypothetical protein